MVTGPRKYNTVPKPGTFFIKRPDKIVFPHVLRPGVSFTTGETIKYLVPGTPLVNKEVVLLLDIKKQSDILKNTETSTDPIYFVVYNLPAQELQYLKLAPVVYMSHPIFQEADFKKALTASSHMFFMDFDPL